MEGALLSQTDAYIQTDLLRTERYFQTLSSRELQNLEFSLSPEGKGGCHGCKTDQLKELFKQLDMLKKELTRQHSTQESKGVIGKRYYELTWAKQQP